MDTPLTVLIPTHGRPTLLRRTLESVAACAQPAGYAGCVVVENGPPAGAEAVVAEVARAYPEAAFRYLHHAPANKSAALNAALEGGEGLAVFFDDDVRVAPGTLGAYADAARRHPAGAFFGGPFSVEYEGEAPPDWLRPMLPRSARGMEFDGSDPDNDYLGFNWAAYAEDLRAAGRFNPSLGPGSALGVNGDEAELQQRLLARGAQAVDVPDARVWHHVPADRSSAPWGARRRYQRGLYAGLHVPPAQALSHGAASVAGAARCLGVAAMARARGETERYWRARFGWDYHRGVIRGLVGSAGRPPVGTDG